MSNCWPGLRALLNHYGLEDLFDATILSCEIGAGKPDETIYREALRQLDVTPDEAVFIDDLPANVTGARAIGMHAIHFRDTPSLKSELAAILREDGGRRTKDEG